MKLPNQPVVLCVLIVCLTLLIFTAYAQFALRTAAERLYAGSVGCDGLRIR